LHFVGLFVLSIVSSYLILCTVRSIIYNRKPMLIAGTILFLLLGYIILWEMNVRISNDQSAHQVLPHLPL
jgi:hypothetical protein